MHGSACPDPTPCQPPRILPTEQAGDLLLAHSLADADGICGYLFFDLMDEQIYEAVREYPLDDVVITDRYDNLIFAVGRQNADPMEKYPAGKYRMD